MTTSRLQLKFPRYEARPHGDHFGVFDTFTQAFCFGLDFASVHQAELSARRHNFYYQQVKENTRRYVDGLE